MKLIGHEGYKTGTIMFMGAIPELPKGDDENLWVCSCTHLGTVMTGPCSWVWQWTNHWANTMEPSENAGFFSVFALCLSTQLMVYTNRCEENKGVFVMRRAVHVPGANSFL